MQSGRFLGLLIKTGLSLIKNTIQPLAKGVLIPLGLTEAVLASDAGIYKTILGSGTTTLIISNGAMKGVMKIVKSLEDSGLILKWFSETIQNEARE